ncbi:MAG: 16S rRNA (cytosine(1402)-N(4))-methyltransferase RsmH, partial [Chloroflexi bacterium]|nr:16S rRNA (cytosine(1402)-N(4))-methyltransferase RsmH [Chloroflexota bacterium]
FSGADGILFDLGLSSAQLERAERGFSFANEGPLDMRFDQRQELSAERIINQSVERELADLIYQLGEERQSRRIARAIVSARPIRTTARLAEVVAGAVGGKRGRIHPATRTFQALRMAVNTELEAIGEGLKQAVGSLGSGGRLVVISYHSLEDRLVKEFMRRESKNCVCEPDAPGCTCKHIALIRIITKKVVKPTQEETKGNPRSRSAKLRIAERL